MPTLTFRIKKRPDADALLVLVREDGSSTSGAIGPAAGYGPAHDLSHYVVERTLGLSEGFLGLVASGWEIADFEIKGTARRLPEEAIFAEVAAGELSRQEMMHQFSSAEDFAWAVQVAMEGIRPGYQGPEITEGAFESMRASLAELRQRWLALATGDTIELSFVAARPSTCPRPARPADAPDPARRRR